MKRRAIRKLGNLLALGLSSVATLIGLGSILFVITFIVLSIAKVMLIRLQRQAGS